MVQPNSKRSFSLEDSERCLGENLQIHGQVPLFDIADVHRHSFFVGDILPAMNLPVSSETRLYRKQEVCVLTVFCQLRCCDHSWANKAHLASQNVEQLGQFIQTHFPEKRAYFGYTRIILQLEVALKFNLQGRVDLQKRI